MSPAKAFVELCQNSLPYLSEHGGPLPYDGDNLSLPDANVCPLEPLQHLSSVHRELVMGASQSMLRTELEAQQELSNSGLSKAHVDPAFNSPHIYADFLKKLHSRSLIDYIHDSTAYMGVFFVRKKNGKLRIILDTRIVNCLFQDPPKVRLPSSAAFAAVESRAETLYFAGGDIDNAFYRIAAPKCVLPYFTLPHIRAKHLGCPIINGVRTHPDEWVTPRLNVLPMGWSWSLWFCQSIIEEVGRCSGHSDNNMVADRKSHTQLTCNSVLHAKYVDNFISFGHDPNTVGLANQSIVTSLNDLNLKVHEEFDVTTNTTFCGIDFDGNKRTMAVSHSRIWKIRFAIEYILSCDEISGGSLEHIIGHFTWSALARREALSILHATYLFMHLYPDTQKGPIWDSVRQEIMWARSILPALVASLDLEWSSRLTCTDSSHLGFGVVECDLDSTLIGNCGRTPEKWRFQLEDAIKARNHSLPTSCSVPQQIDVPPENFGQLPDSSDGVAAPAGPDSPPCGFDEVPDSLLKGGPWVVVQSRRWDYLENILATEARALVWAIRRLCRSAKFHNKRLLFLVDNLPLVLAITKGRATSTHLIGPCRQVAAHSFASGSRFNSRWIASERNPADKPSREFRTVGPSKKLAVLKHYGKDNEINETGKYKGPCPSAQKAIQSSRASTPLKGCSEAEAGRSPATPSAPPGLSRVDLAGESPSRTDRSISHRPAARCSAVRSSGNTSPKSPRTCCDDSPPHYAELRRTELGEEVRDEETCLTSGGDEGLSCSSALCNIWQQVHTLSGHHWPDQPLRGHRDKGGHQSRLRCTPEGTGELADGGGSPPSSHITSDFAVPARLHRWTILVRALSLRQFQDFRRCAGLGTGGPITSSPLQPRQTSSLGLCKASASRKQGGASRGGYVCNHRNVDSSRQAGDSSERVDPSGLFMQTGGSGQPPGTPAGTASHSRKTLGHSPGALQARKARQNRRVRRERAPGRSRSPRDAPDTHAAREQPRRVGQPLEQVIRGVRKLVQRRSHNAQDRPPPHRKVQFATRSGQCRYPTPTPQSRRSSVPPPTQKRLLDQEVHQGSKNPKVHAPVPKRGAKLRHAGIDPIASAISGERISPPSRRLLRKQLNKLLKQVLRISKTSGQYRVFLELFSGSGHLSKVFNRNGIGSISVDIKHSLCFDLTNPVVVEVICGWLTSKHILGVWLGTPCSSWSRARHDLNGGGPRTKTHIYGIPLLSAADQIRVDFGNCTMRTSVKIIEKCIHLRIPTFLENPATSMLFDAPPIQRLRCKAQECVSDYCQYGKPWRKRTKVLAWCIDTSEAPCMKCQGRGGVCSRTNRSHTVLTGLHPQLHIPWTKYAEPYPEPWCRKWFQVVKNGTINASLHRLTQLCM